MPQDGETCGDLAVIIRQEPKEATLEARREAVQELTRRAAGGDAESFDLLVQMAGEQRYVQKYVVEALGKTGNPEAVGVLERFIAYEISEVARSAARALAELGSSGCVQVLLAGLRANVGRPDGYGEEVRREIVEALAALRAREAAGALAAELESEEDLTFKNLVAGALGGIGSKDALPALKRHLEGLLANEPEESIGRFLWEEGIRMAREAIQAIEAGRDD